MENTTLFKGNIFDELAKAFQRVITKSHINRINTHKEFAAFYNNDYEEITAYLKRDTLNNPFSEETLRTLRFRHVNVIKKLINRITSGIMIKNPVVNLITAEQNTESDKLLTEILKQTRFFKKIKDAFRKAVYYNIVEAHVVWDSEKGVMRIDIITPNNFDVDTKSDYLDKSEIVISKADEKGNLYLSYWSESEHYNIKGGVKEAPAADNTGMLNPYTEKAKALKISSLPFATLRMEDGIDYFGEPNWNIFLHQKNFDIRLTDLNESELKSIHQIMLGINTNFAKGETFKAGDLKQVNGVRKDETQPDIKPINSSVEYTSLRENIDWHNKIVMNSEGIDSNSASTDKNTPQSGTSKLIDQAETFEIREESKEVLYDFIINLLHVMRMVWNTYNPGKALSEKDLFDCIFVESNMFKSTADKEKEYDMFIKYKFMDEVDICMKELEISEQEAIEMIKKKMDRRKEIGLVNETVPPVDNNPKPGSSAA